MMQTNEIQAPESNLEDDSKLSAEDRFLVIRRNDSRKPGDLSFSTFPSKKETVAVITELKKSGLFVDAFQITKRLVIQEQLTYTF